MCSSRNQLLSQKEIVQFTLPRLHKGKHWYVDFFAYDPKRDAMRRKKYMLDRYKSARDREKFAAILIHNLFEKLKLGWNPWTTASRTRHFTEFSKVLERYEAYTYRAKEKGVLKGKTAIDYRSRLNQMRIYLDEVSTGVRYAYDFNRSFAIDFLDYLILDKDVSAKTRNNYRTWLSTFGNWMVERLYIEKNIILDDVLKLNNSDFVKIAANGDYMFNKDGDEATPSHPYINKIWVEKANVNNNFRLHITLPSQSAGARRTKLSNPVTAEGKLAEFHYTGAASNDIRELKEASVSSDVEISVAVSADLKRAVKTFKTLTLTVPSYMRLDLRQCSPSQPDYDAATGVVTFHNVSSTANIKLRAAVKTLDFQKPATRDNKLRFTPGQNGKDGQVDLNGVLNVGISFERWRPLPLS